MNCENCEQQHGGTYGSGRFCSSKCARGFSTKEKREEINKRVSKTLKEQKRAGTKYNRTKPLPQELPGWGERMRTLAIKRREKKLRELNWNEYSMSLKRYVVLKDQDEKCNRCKRNTWLGEHLTLELEHKDGNRYNNERSNLEFLCPNCHSLTKTWRGRNQAPKRKKRVTDAVLKEAIRTSTSINQALKKVGLAGGKNYKRANRLFEELEEC